LSYHLAQVNIALPLEPLDSSLLSEFVERLAPVNAAADRAPGFVWRLQTEHGDATAITAFGDDRLIVNLSVWESMTALRAFVFGSRAHLDVLRRRREWFARLGEVHLALWWVRGGQLPTVADAEERLAQLRAHGPRPEAFTFREHFPAPGAGGSASTLDDRRLCPAG